MLAILSVISATTRPTFQKRPKFSASRNLFIALKNYLLSLAHLATELHPLLHYMNKGASCTVVNPLPTEWGGDVVARG